MSDPRRSIPSVEALLASPSFEPLVASAGRPRVVSAVRAVQAAVREALAGEESPGSVPADEAEYAARVGAELERSAVPSLRRVINATGVVLHTNLGRAPLADTARAAMAAVAGYASVEYDLEAGGRGSRDDHCSTLLRALTGAESALVVNNNAAAVVLALNTLASGGVAVISRGELVEIGGSFRVPEIMARSGATMREVGSTNRTHLEDYAAALAEDVRLILKVHRSNFRVEGFTAEVDPSELATLARDAGLPLVHDLGSGALIDLSLLGLPHEPTAGDALKAGAAVVTMSGDKLLGGPQAGIILGRKEILDRMRSNPLCRALRCDKVTLAGLEATLALYRDDRAMGDVPVLRMLSQDADTLRARADELSVRLTRGGVACDVVQAGAAVGGGAYPGVELPGWAVALEGPDGPESLARALRTGEPPVIAQIRDGRLLLHLRTVDEGRTEELEGRVLAAAGAVAP